MVINPSPHPWDISLGGHGYMIDTGSQQWRHDSIPLLRPSYVTSDRLGENDINPESLWRFSDIDWSHGAGQRRADLPSSDSSRFWRSRGVDVWTKWQASLLPAVERRTLALGVARFFVVQGITYILGNGAGTFGGLTFGAPSFSNVVVPAGTNIFGACTDGKVIYYTDSLAVYSKNVGVTGAGTVFNTITGIDLLFYAAGRLIGISGSNGHVIDITGSTFTDLGALPGNMVPVDVTAGINGIYVAASNPDTGQAQVFLVTINSAGTGLNPPIAATPPFDGTLYRILYYEGLVFLGQKEGVRMAVPSTDGSALTLTPLIATGPCSALAGHNGQVWFGIDNYELDATGTTYWSGLGRLDPTILHDDGSPAWATDVMLDQFPLNTVGGGPYNPQILDLTYNSVADDWSAFGGLVLATTRGFITPFPGTPPTQRVASGYIDSGLISYDLPDEKTARYLTVRADITSQGEIDASIAVDGSSTFTSIGVLPQGGTSVRLPIPGTPAGGAFEIRETLKQSTSSVYAGAVMVRDMLEADPIVPSGFFLSVPLLLAEEESTGDGKTRRVDVNAERAYLYGLRESGTVVTYTELGVDYQVTVEDVTWVGTHITTKRDAVNGTLLLKLKTV